MEDNKIPISVAIIAKNEEKRLPYCLKSVSFAQEVVVVVDLKSMDKTAEIARSYNARVFIEEWKGFSEQKQFAVDQCLNDWVLILDADERVPDDTALIIRNLLELDNGLVGAYSFRRKNYFHGKWIKHCGWWPDRIVRLVKREKGSFNNRLVHECWVTKLSIKELDAHIEHFSFRNYSDLIAKMERYSYLAAKEMKEKRNWGHPFIAILHGLWMFFRTCFIEKGILDGFDGFMISAMNGLGSFMKYAKLWELRTKGE